VPTAGSMRPASVFHMARDFCFKLLRINPSKPELLCRSDAGLPLLTFFPVMFGCSESENEHRRRCKAATHILNPSGKEMLAISFRMIKFGPLRKTFGRPCSKRSERAHTGLSCYAENTGTKKNRM